MSISSLSSSSAVQHTINISSMDVYEHFEFIFVAFLQLYSVHILTKSFTTDSPKSHNPVKSVHFIQIVSIVLAVVAYNAGIYTQCCLPIMLKIMLP